MPRRSSVSISLNSVGRSTTTPLRDDRHDVVVQDAARDQLQRVALVADDHGVPGVVTALVAHDVAVLLRQQVDDLGLALVAPLGANDDGDRHGTLLAELGAAGVVRPPDGTCADRSPLAAATRQAHRVSAIPSPVMSSPVLRRMTWASMPEDERAALCHRGLDEIFDPALRAAIGRIIDDVREHGDEAVCRALRDFDGIDAARRTSCACPTTRSTRAMISAEVDAAIDDAIAHLRAFNERLVERACDWSFESEPGLHRRREGHADRQRRAVRAERQGELPERRLPAGRAGGGGGRARDRAGRAAGARVAAARSTPPCWSVCRKLGIADVFRVNGPAGIAALGFGTETFPKVRKIVGPGSPAVTCAQVEMQRHGVATMMLLGPTESVVIADDSADPVRLAADLLIEAEHGTDSAVVLLTHVGDDRRRRRRRARPAARSISRRLGPWRRARASA